MRTRNVDLLERVADKVEAEPEQWYQPEVVMEWEDCGTTYCLGGWAIKLAGENPDDASLSRATELLGLSFDESHFIFYEGMGHRLEEHAHKEVAEWLRAIARGESVEDSAPEWWVSEL